jgi:hypothetical protein
MRERGAEPEPPSVRPASRPGPQMGGGPILFAWGNKASLPSGPVLVDAWPCKTTTRLIGAGCCANVLKGDAWMKISVCKHKHGDL